MATENFTRQYQLIEDISNQGVFWANPAGRQGFEVVLLEKVGDAGSRFYCSLKPGETLGFGEKLFGKYQALAIDIRHGRAFPIDGEFETADRGHKVKIQANVRFHVTDAKIVAMETLDSLGELRDKVRASLIRNIARYPESKIIPDLIERIITGVNNTLHLGIAIEDAEIIQFTSDSKKTEHVIQEEDLDHDIRISDKKQLAELNSNSKKKQAEIKWKQDEIKALPYSDVNVLLHEHPELIPAMMDAFNKKQMALLDARINIVSPAIKAYIKQQEDIDAEIDPMKIVNIMRDAIEFPNTQTQNLLGGPEIVWGKVVDDLPSAEEQVKPEETESKPVSKKNTDDEKNIKFG